MDIGGAKVGFGTSGLAARGVIDGVGGRAPSDDVLEISHIGGKVADASVAVLEDAASANVLDVFLALLTPPPIGWRLCFAGKQASPGGDEFVPSVTTLRAHLAGTSTADRV